MIDYTIMSENASNHWPHFNVNGKNVLDIGCGIWYTEDMEETSPVFFGKTASSVVGVDSHEGDIERFKKYVGNNKKFTFKEARIANVQQIRDLIKEHKITALKSDIEGDEKVLLELTTEDLGNITEIAIEFHTHDLKHSFMEKIPEWGFDIKCVANFARTPDNLGVIFGSK